MEKLKKKKQIIISRDAIEQNSFFSTRSSRSLNSNMHTKPGSEIRARVCLMKKNKIIIATQMQKKIK